MKFRIPEGMAIIAFCGLEVVATAVGSSALSAQTPEFRTPALLGEQLPVTHVAGGGAFGWSQAITLLLVDTHERLDATTLDVFGGGWQLGHRWLRPYVDDAPGLPGEPVDVAARGPAYTTTSAVEGDIVAPAEPGVWQLESANGTRVTVATRTPASLARGGRLNGYHIGTYPTAGADRADAYVPPEFFIEVTPETQHLPVSKHLTLGQFLTKDQFDVWPKYVALDLRLIDKLELVVQELRAMGVRADRVHVMSGFRTPQYNGPGGDGRASLSRHMWGDAADVWIDNDANGFMDDLNGDGRVDLWDAVLILRAVDRVERKYPELVGGAGLYPETPTHGPYIHIDARGHHSRW